ncbi:matrixin family metalloprotease [Kineococcus arenarius]|uniref:matrixin family metalloprotease n=1 Tax=Kineococcus sp. SYSU DK007 TaxID=3383128 RepID=UPI003D7C3E5A
MHDSPLSRRSQKAGQHPRDGAVRRSSSGRIPQWAMDEAAGRPGTAPTWRGDSVDTSAGTTVGTAAGGTGHRRNQRRRSSWSRARARARLRGRVGVAAVVLAVAAGTAWAHTSGLTAGSAAGSAATRAGQAPSPGHEAADTPLGQPAPLTQSSDAWRALHTQTDGTTPVAWDPCRPIHYVTRPDAAPAGAGELLTQAIARVSTATGLRFIDDGTTTEGPDPQREPYQPQRYGDRWAPVLITYVSAAEVPDIAAAVIAQARPVTITTTQPSTWDRLSGRPGEPVAVYVSGAVQVDAAQVADALTHPGGTELVRAVFEHELGHLLGLAHVDDPGQLMYPQTAEQYDYAAGDLTGLAALGTGTCVPEL